MNLNLEWLAILTGLGIGLLSSIVGAALQYWALKRSSEITFRAPNLILPVSGLLGVMGLVAILLSLATGWLRLALFTGIGVLSGFLLGFIIMVALWCALRRMLQHRHANSQRMHGA